VPSGSRPEYLEHPPPELQALENTGECSAATLFFCIMTPLNRLTSMSDGFGTTEFSYTPIGQSGERGDQQWAGPKHRRQTPLKMSLQTEASAGNITVMGIVSPNATSVSVNGAAGLRCMADATFAVPKTSPLTTGKTSRPAAMGTAKTLNANLRALATSHPPDRP